MAQCSKCGKQSMSFTCKYCGEKFCSEHRLPENHDCEKMEESIEKEKEETGKWFTEKKVKNPSKASAKTVSQTSLLQDIWDTLSRNYTLGIILFTVAVFMVQMLLEGMGMGQQFFNFLSLQPGLENVLQKPWTLVTVMFLHGGAFHLFANMVTFYFFGNPVEKVIGGKKLLKFYFGSGIIASIAFVLFRNFLAVFQGTGVLGPAVGASGAVIATFAVVAMLYPEAEVLLYFIFPMKIKTALYAFLGMEVVNVLAKSVGIYLPLIGNFASSAHLAGALVGIWYGKKLRQKHSQKTGVIDLLGY